MVTGRSPVEMLAVDVVSRRPVKKCVIFQLSPAGGARQPPLSPGLAAKTRFSSKLRSL
jgi:hypothetical protein